MGIYARLVDFDAEFESVEDEAKIVNDYDTRIPEQKEELDRLFYTHYVHTDTIEDTASCEYGHYTAAYNIGRLCPICKTKVEPIIGRPVKSVLWIRAPDGVTALFSPQAYLMLEKPLKVKDFNFLEYLTNTDYHYDPDRIVSKETRRKLDRLLSAELPPRGWNSFIENFDTIMAFLFSANIVDSSKANKGELWRFIEENKQYFFPKHLPLPSKICFVVESTNSAVYIDKPLGTAMDAVHTITSIRGGDKPSRPSVVQNKTAKAIRELAEFYDTYTRERLAKKRGMYRRHVFGSRLHFSGRAVISSISEPHDYRELHIPWGMAAQLFKYHLINKLMKRRYTVNQALNFVYSNVLQYHPLMDELFQELIAEAPGLGPACSFQRNPFVESL